MATMGYLRIKIRFPVPMGYWRRDAPSKVSLVTLLLRPMPELPLNDPLIRYALGHPELYPMINADTVHCLTPPATEPEPRRRYD